MDVSIAQMVWTGRFIDRPLGLMSLTRFWAAAKAAWLGGFDNSG
jgi:hypothetical protein